MDSQLQFIPAAKAAGVKLFVPAEYGIELAVGLNTPKGLVREALKKINLPYTLFYTGFFADLFHHFLGYSYAQGIIRIVGKGSTAFSLTSRLDIARFIAQALTVGTPVDLQWAMLSIEASRKTPMEIKAMAEKKLGKSIEVNFVDYDENALAANSDVVAFLSKAVEDGDAVAGTPEQVEKTIAKFYPDWNPTPMETFIGA